MKTLRIIIAALFALSVAATSCSKHSDFELPSNPSRSATDNAIAENAFNDIFKQAEDGMEAAKNTVEGNHASYSSLSGVATVTIDPYDLTTFPKTITVDFGNTNVMCNDGKLRRGKIIIVATGWYRDSASVITATPDNYFVNDNHVEGYHTITNNGHNTTGNLNYDIEVDGTVSTQEGTIYWHSNRNNEWIEGESTVFNPWDDVYLVTGTANGTNVNGEAYTWTIVTPLRVEIGCKWVTEGVLMLEANGEQLLIDYGNGNCDGLVTVTYNGNDYQIYV